MSLHSGNSFFFATQDTSLMDMLTGSLGGRVNGVNLYDMAQFVEEFVLMEKVWVYHDFYCMLNTELRRICPEAGDILFNAMDGITYHESQSSFLNDSDRDTVSKIISVADRIEERVKTRGLVFDDRCAYIEAITLLMQEWSSYLGIHTRAVKLETAYIKSPMYLRDRISLESLLSSNLISDKVMERIQGVHFLCRRSGLNVSPGIVYAPYFVEADKSQPSTIKLLYEAVASSHREVVKRLEDTGGLSLVYVPPLLSILLDRTKNRDHLLEELVKLRVDFTGLREQASYFREGIRSAVTLREKLDVLNEFDSAREALIKKTTRKPSRSVVKEVWDIVKGKSLWGSVTKVADMALQWDQERQFIRRVNRFQLMSDLALKIPKYETLLEKIYGAKAIDYRDIRITNSPRIALTKAQSSLAG